MYQLLAALAFVAHLAFIIFVLVGSVLVWRWPWVAFGHIPCVIWGLLMEFVPSLFCPLTPLEQSLLQKAGEKGYETGFVEHYIAPLIYPDVNPAFFYQAGVFLLSINLVLYFLVIRQIRARRGN